VLAHSFGGQERSDFMDRSFSFSSCCVPFPFRLCYPEMRSLAGSLVCPYSPQPPLLLPSLSALCSALARPQCCRHCSTAGPPWSSVCAKPLCQNKIWEMVPNARPRQHFSSPLHHSHAEQCRTCRLGLSWCHLLRDTHF